MFNFFYFLSLLFVIEINAEKDLDFINICLNETLIREIPKEKPNPIISIVISLYNKEDTVISTLRSVQNQNFSEFEIILIDDCSTDNSYKTAQKEAEKDKRIILEKNEKNRGIFYTKIKGIKKAKGKYLLILDADDIYCEQNVFRLLVKEIESKNVDFVYFCAVTGKIDNLITKWFHSPPKYGIVEQPELKYIIPKSRIGTFVWNKFYKTSVFQKACDFIGKENSEIYLNYMDDQPQLFALFHVAQNYSGIKDKLIYYKTQKTSISYKSDFIKLPDILAVANLLYELSENTEEDKLEFSLMVESFFINYLADLVIKSPHINGYYEFCLKHFDEKLLTEKRRIKLNNFCNIIFKKYSDNKKENFTQINKEKISSNKTKDSLLENNTKQEFFSLLKTDKNNSFITSINSIFQNKTDNIDLESNISLSELKQKNDSSNILNNELSSNELEENNTNPIENKNQFEISIEKKLTEIKEGEKKVKKKLMLIDFFFYGVVFIAFLIIGFLIRYLIVHVNYNYNYVPDSIDISSKDINNE